MVLGAFHHPYTACGGADLQRVDVCRHPVIRGTGKPAEQSCDAGDFACVDGPEFDGHLVDFDQALQRSRLYKTQEGELMLRLTEGDTHSGGCGMCS